MFKFYIDDQEKGTWSGEVDWSNETYVLSEGLHTLKWTYSKDVYVGDGSDCAWVDNIKFPPTAVVVDIEEVEETEINVYPNPAKDVVKLSVVNGQLSVLKIYNMLGMLVDEIEMDVNNMEINISDYNPGIYFFNINGEVVKVIKN